MNDLAKQERNIQDEVDRLREQFSNTRDLYREVCALLFFRYGITPTTNKLYQFVRKGSMSVPTEVLSDFWKELREKSRLQISQPDLPEELGSLAGEMVTTLWEKALKAAHDSLKVFRGESEAKMNALRTELNNQLQKSLELEKLFANSNIYKSSLEEQLTQSLSERKAIQLSMENERKKMEIELENYRSMIDDINTRNHFEMSKVILESDREKSIAAKLDEELATIRIIHTKLQDQNKNETHLLNTQIGNLREKIGALNGRLHVAETNNEQLKTELMTKEVKLKDIMTKLDKQESQKPKWQLMVQMKNKRFKPH